MKSLLKCFQAISQLCLCFWPVRDNFNPSSCVYADVFFFCINSEQLVSLLSCDSVLPPRSIFCGTFFWKRNELSTFTTTFFLLSLLEFLGAYGHETGGKCTYKNSSSFSTYTGKQWKKWLCCQQNRKRALNISRGEREKRMSCVEQKPKINHVYFLGPKQNFKFACMA